MFSHHILTLKDTTAVLSHKHVHNFASECTTQPSQPDYATTFYTNNKKETHFAEIVSTSFILKQLIITQTNQKYNTHLGFEIFQFCS